MHELFIPRVSHYRPNNKSYKWDVMSQALCGVCDVAGFNISLEPGFSVTRLCWMLAYGGIYAVANLRFHYFTDQ
jgi:prolyl oligopeptidase PreP (S9A serine peptidase family)